jgi:hypothetical protein
MRALSVSTPRASAACVVVVATSAALGAVVACGARTGLPDEESPEVADAEPEHGFIFPDHFVEDRVVEPETKEEDVVEEIPGIDVNRPDVPLVRLCPDAEATLIYVIGESNQLYSFDPATRSFATVGTISCPGAEGDPFSMAVDRRGVAYVLFSDVPAAGGAEVGTGIFRVSTKDASCRRTAYDPAKHGDVTFGMGFVANDVEGGAADAGDGETLYVSVDNGTGDGELSSLDTETFDMRRVGRYAPPVKEAELTGTSTGQLFAFQPYLPMTTSGAFIFEVDDRDAKVQGQDRLLVGGKDLMAGSGWAFGYWGGNFYTFTANGPALPNGEQSTVVNRFDPMTKTLEQVAALTTDTIVGAGVSTCAPTVP